MFKESKTLQRESAPKPKLPKFFYLFIYYFFFKKFGGLGVQQPLKVYQASANISNFDFFQLWFWLLVLMSFRTPIKLILLSLEISGFLVSKTLKKLKFQLLNKKLWPQEVS